MEDRNKIARARAKAAVSHLQAADAGDQNCEDLLASKAALEASLAAVCELIAENCPQGEPN